MIVAVIGATSGPGPGVIERLRAAGHRVIAVGRSEARLGGLPGAPARAVADLADPAALARALAPASRVVSLAPARFAGAVLAALPPDCERVVLTGSLRRDSAVEDPVREAARNAEDLLARSGVPGVVLHPAMIYGRPGDRNVGRVVSLVRRWPRRLPLVVPLPARGKRAVQPVHVDDVAAAVAAAVMRPEAPGPPIAVVGPEPITYAALVHECAAALGRRAWIVPAPPASVMLALGRLAGVRVDAAELRRAGENKRYDPGPMVRRLGVTPRPFPDGLRSMLASDAGAAVTGPH